MEIQSASQFEELLNEEGLFREELDKRHKISNKKYH